MPKPKAQRDTYYSHVVFHTDFYNLILLGINLPCAIALVVLSAQAAVRVDGSPELKHSTEYPVLRPAAISTAAWAGFALFHCIITIILVIRWSRGIYPRYPPGEMVALAVNGAINLLLVGTLVVLVVVQRSFLPRPWGECRGLGQLARAGAGPGGEWGSWVDVLAKKKGEKERHGVCMRFVHMWRLELAMMIILGFTTTCSIYGAIRRKCMRSKTQAQGRYLNRLAQRYEELAILQAQQQLQQQPEESDAASTPGSNPTAHHDSQAPVEREKSSTTVQRSLTSGARGLEVILSQYELLVTIAAQSHYHSMHSLLQVSRGIRAAILGTLPPRSLWAKTLCGPHQYHPRDIADIVPPLPTTFGVYYARMPCFSCGTRVCYQCSAPRLLSTATTRHLRDCAPCCSSCFRDRYCFVPRSKAATKLPALCDWRTDPHDRRVEFVNSQGDKGVITVWARNVLPAWVRLCEVCARERTRVQIVGLGGTCAWVKVVESKSETRVEREPRFECVGCEKGIGAGEFVWWMCKWCGRECGGGKEGFHKEALVVPRCVHGDRH